MARNKHSHGRGRGRGKKEKKVFPVVTGKVQMTREGYAFVIVEGEDDDVFVKASKTRGALHGDSHKYYFSPSAIDFAKQNQREGH